MSVKHEIRALSSALSNVPNVKYLAHLARQTQKRTFIRCAKCAKIIEHATLRSHFWKRMDPNAISIYCFFIHLSLSSLTTLFLFFFSPLSFFLRHSPSLFSLFFLLIVVAFLSSVQPRRSLLLQFFFFLVFWWVASAMGGFSLPFSLAAPPNTDLCCCGFFFFGSDLMGGFGSGWLLSSV